MKPSEAILKGCEMRPRQARQLIDGEDGACVNGALCLGLGLSVGEIVGGFGVCPPKGRRALPNAAAFLPALRAAAVNRGILSPSQRAPSAAFIMANLNDIGGVSREEIAALLAEDGF
jgi:hypothetical protein